MGWGEYEKGKRSLSGNTFIKSCTIQRHRDVSEPTDVLAWTSCLDEVNRFVRQSLREPFSLAERATSTHY